MRKLTSAHFSRLIKDKAFWLISAVVLVGSLVAILNCSRSAAEMIASGYIVTLDDYFFTQAPFMGLYFAVFISLFLGTEYADGAVRNKLVVGASRLDVYLSGLAVSMGAGIFFLCLWWLGSVPGLLLVGPLEMGIGGFLLNVLVAVGFTMALTSIFTAVSSLSDNRAITVVLTLVVWLILLFASSALDDRLCEPELHSGVMVTANGFEIGDPEPNPLYLSGNIRTLFECLLDFLPTGQAILMSDNAIAHPLRQLIFSVIVTVGSSAAGLFAFRRKDLK